ncbi:MAG: cytochrome c3 family protein [Acidobacteria bacterium]|nr:cytochrome c3 family protein [Acidobacteriota bacterium]
MKKTLILVACAAFAIALAVAANIPSGKETLTFDAKMGAVTFGHKMHVDKGVSCTTCHHTSKEGETPQACSSCHDAKVAKDKAPKLQDAMHTSCYGCHEKTAAAGKKAGPVKKDCKVCHVKA